MGSAVATPSSDDRDSAFIYIFSQIHLHISLQSMHNLNEYNKTQEEAGRHKEDNEILKGSAKLMTAADLRHHAWCLAALKPLDVCTKAQIKTCIVSRALCARADHSAGEAWGSQG
jgi:hypothetical protein